MPASIFSVLTCQALSRLGLKRIGETSEPVVSIGKTQKDCVILFGSQKLCRLSQRHYPHQIV
jgi:hypothetical protein